MTQISDEMRTSPVQEKSYREAVLQALLACQQGKGSMAANRVTTIKTSNLQLLYTQGTFKNANNYKPAAYN